MSFVIVQRADAATFLSSVAAVTQVNESGISVTNLNPGDFIQFCQQQDHILFFGDKQMRDALMNMTGTVMRCLQRACYNYAHGDIAILLVIQNARLASHENFFVMVSPCFDQSYSVQPTSALAQR